MPGKARPQGLQRTTEVSLEYPHELRYPILGTFFCVINTVRWVLGFVWGGERPGNRRFWAASRPNPAPGGLGEGPLPGAPLDSHRCAARLTNSKVFPYGFLNHLVTALELLRNHRLAQSVVAPTITL